MLKKYEHGNVSIEYVAGLFALLTVLLAPIFPNGSAIDYLVFAMKNDYAGFSYSINKPRLPVDFKK